ncbi:DUF3833 domain-containing protein [Meridianimarinicoccus roseus]|jgi:hypothetical protein|uniref:DUF3833 domain-containing protein n=1 Tax=Meridianimarinicoccus roseus TaxID=2072018 RepID=A0A2V2LHG4_9RHOB|nr:DUF3833 family protein [Meridianimarinicoccus roseus]PWR01819.1 DUF3833 domain-containing protein [Meridianimarinicoccus roseus]
MDVLLYVALGAVLTLAGSALVRRVWSFRAQTPDDYAGQEPAFDIRRHLDGALACEGVIYGPTGRVSARFVAQMHATWDGDRGVMTEHFRYDSGAVQDRAWELTLRPDGTIRAEAEDLVGTGTGMQKGAGVMLRYRIRLPESSGGHVLDTVDWMYLMENGTIINRSEFRKFGLKVAELVATMRPAEAADAGSDRVAAE